MIGSTIDQQIAWIQRHCPLTRGALGRLPEPLPGRLAVRFHLDLKMVPLLLELHRRGRKAPGPEPGLTVLACNDQTVDPDAKRLLEQHGIACRNASTAPAEALTRDPGGLFLCDLGGQLIRDAHRRGLAIAGAMEGTTSGLSLLQEAGIQSPDFPLLDWNGNLLKVALHNEKMVGFSVWQTFHEVTRLSLHGQTVAVLGFGGVGRGLARTARNHGAEVLVFEPDPELQHLARCEGFSLPPRKQLLARAQVLVSATGRMEALTREDLAALRSGVFVLNAGHDSEELCREIRVGLPRRTVLAQVEEVDLDSHGRIAFLLGGGQVFNLSAGFGDSINSFDVTLANLVESLAYLFELAGSPTGPRGWLKLPRSRSQRVWALSGPSETGP